MGRVLCSYIVVAGAIVLGACGGSAAPNTQNVQATVQAAVAGTQSAQSVPSGSSSSARSSAPANQASSSAGAEDTGRSFFSALINGDPNGAYAMLPASEQGAENQERVRQLAAALRSCGTSSVTKQYESQNGGEIWPVDVYFAPPCGELSGFNQPFKYSGPAKNCRINV
jgi:hypothetical protein